MRTGGLSGSRLAEVGERVGVRVPSGPRFGVDGAFEGFVRLPFTVGGPVADEAAVRLAAAARLVESGRAAAGRSRRARSWRSPAGAGAFRTYGGAGADRGVRTRPSAWFPVLSPPPGPGRGAGPDRAPEPARAR